MAHEVISDRYLGTHDIVIDQSSAIKAWDGKKENADAVQKALLARAQTNSEVSKGEYVAGSQPNNFESLYVKNYVY